MFGHIYVESRVATHPFTKSILAKFKDSQLIEIEHYKQFFNRPNQNFLVQNKSPKLILAKQEEHFLHQGSDRVRSFGDEHIISCSMIRNCIYHCEYCFLSGMHESANIVIYVNIEDFEQEVKKVSEALYPQKIYLVSSYLSDLPAIENLIPLSRMWIDITEKFKNIDLEIRTKSDAYHALRAIGVRDHVVLTWSLSPQHIVRLYEHGTASLPTRILQAYQAIQDGWRTRLCFDPIIYYEGWQKDYVQCVAQTFARIKPEQVEKISYGVFRMGITYLQKMRRLRPGAKVLQQYVESKHGLGTYSPEIITEIKETFGAIIQEYLPAEKIHFVHG